MTASAAARALDIADLLSTRKVEVERAYNQLRDQAAEREKQSQIGLQEMLRLEGESRCLADLSLSLSKETQ